MDELVEQTGTHVSAGVPAGTGTSWHLLFESQVTHVPGGPAAQFAAQVAGSSSLQSKRPLA